MDELIKLIEKKGIAVEFYNFYEFNYFINYIKHNYDLKLPDLIELMSERLEENFNINIIAFIDDNELYIANRELFVPERKKNILKCSDFIDNDNFIDLKSLPILDASKCFDLNTVKIPKTTLDILEKKYEEDNKKEKEDIMDILDLYYKKEKEKINKDFDEKIKKVIEDDEIQVIVKAMLSQINIILENENSDKIFDNSIGKLNYLVTKKTALDNTILVESQDKILDELKDKVLEIRTLLDMAENYEQKVDILKNYEILDKKGKFIND